MKKYILFVGLILSAFLGFSQIQEQAVLLMKPAAYKATVLYNAIPNTAAGDFDVSRNSIRSRIKNGRIENIAINVPAINWIDGEPSLSLEPERDNEILYSESLDDAYWTLSGATLTGGFSSPHEDYPVSAWKLVEDGSNGQHYIGIATVNISQDDISYTIYAKANGRNWFRLFDARSGNATYFNLNTGTIGSDNGTVTSKTITALANGWYKCTISAGVSPGVTRMRIYLSDADDSSTYQGDGSSGVYLAFPQLEEGAYPTSLIYDGTEGSVTTRYADVISLDGLQSFLGTTTGTIHFEVDGSYSVGSDKDIFVFKDTGAGSELGLRFKSDETWQWYDHHSTELIGTASSSSITSIAIAWDGTNAIISKDGVDESITLDAAFDAITDITTATTYESAYVQLISMYATQLTAAELNILTQ